VRHNLADWLIAQGMPTGVGTITREHIEAFLGDMLDRLSPATAAQHYRSLHRSRPGLPRFRGGNGDPACRWVYRLGNQ
jgi:hypothetical protein